MKITLAGQIRKIPFLLLLIMYSARASLTKIAMYTTGMMLYEQGRFLMSDPLYEYFPEFRHSTKIIQLPNGTLEEVPVEHPITVKQIFNMTCGLPYEMIIGGIPVHHPTGKSNGGEMKALRANGYFTLRDQIKAAARVPLLSNLEPAFFMVLPASDRRSLRSTL